MNAPTRPTDAAWEPEPLELPLEAPRRRELPTRPWTSTDDEEQRTGLPGSHVIVIDIA
jgi:hypothetical protein